MTDIPTNSSEAQSQWHAAFLLSDYADRFWVEDDVLKVFDGAWRKWVQPVMEHGKAHRKLEDNWICFALAYNYLSNEGFHLPLYSKPWAAAIRSFLSILGTECPSHFRSKGPPRWSGEIRIPGDSLPVPDTTDEQIDAVKSFLNAVLLQSETYSLEWITGKIVNEEWEAIPKNHSVAAYLRNGITAHQCPPREKLNVGPMQSLLLNTLGADAKRDEFAERYENARRASLAAQVKVMGQSLSGKRGDQWMNCTIEELSACLLRPKEPGLYPALDPHSEPTTTTLIPARSLFPGKLSKADWLTNDRLLRVPPDPLKMWIAKNWVNPQAPFWMMKASAIYGLLRHTRLMEATASAESDRKELEQGRIREAVRYLGLRDNEWTPPIIDFRPNPDGVTNGFGAERIHEMAAVSINGITVLGAARVTRENFASLEDTVDPQLLDKLFYAT